MFEELKWQKNRPAPTGLLVANISFLNNSTRFQYVALIFISTVRLQIFKLVEALNRMSGQVDDKVAEEKIADCVKVSNFFDFSPFTWYNLLGHN